MKTQKFEARSSAELERGRITDAIRAWHAGETLSAEQLDFIERARRECLGRALGVDV